MSSSIAGPIASGSRAAPQSARGRERYARILAVATQRFLQDGYAKTSIDTILKEAGGSKATVYQYFPTKDDLFRAVIDNVVSNRSQPRLDELDDVRSTLIEYFAKRLTIIFSVRHQALIRLVVAERDKFPDLATMYYRQGPQRSRELLLPYMEKLKSQGKLSFASANEAADFLIGALIHQWHLEMLVLGAEPPSQDQIQHRVERAVDRFLLAFAVQA